MKAICVTTDPGGPRHPGAVPAASGPHADGVGAGQEPGLSRFTVLDNATVSDPARSPPPWRRSAP